MNPNTDDLITPEEFAREAKVHPETIRRLCRQGRLEHVRVGAHIRVPRSALVPRKARSGAGEED